MTNYENKDLWIRRGNNFSVEVSRHDKYDGKNGWCLYIYFFPKHWANKLCSKDYYENDFISSIDFHGGCTYSEQTGSGAWKIGCDYSHYMDDRFDEYKTPEDAWEVFFDADKLFNQFNSDTIKE